MNQFVMNGRKCRFTEHAVERLKEMEMGVVEGYRELRMSVAHKLPKGMAFTKKKYGNHGQDDVFYYKNNLSNILFTVKKKDKELIVITVTQK